MRDMQEEIVKSERDIATKKKYSLYTLTALCSLILRVYTHIYFTLFVDQIESVSVSVVPEETSLEVLSHIQVIFHRFLNRLVVVEAEEVVEEEMTSISSLLPLENSFEVNSNNMYLSCLCNSR